MSSFLMASRGLSPRVRGNLRLVEQQVGPVGSIPACAGEPRGMRMVRSSKRVYPRVCGGTRTCRDYTDVCQGSIPACAGEPALYHPRIAGRRVYPRVCGGTGCGSGVAVESPGLSPRVRGNRLVERRVEARLGSIPACAGEPIPFGIWNTTGVVYPRVCGGTHGKHYATFPVEGLSPRVRGNPVLGDDGEADDGSIPACAGEPRPSGSSGAPPQVYPRVCGGTPAASFASVIAPGLSPRVRGNPRSAAARSRACGSIPACAGEPTCATPTSSGSGVYPRVCGGTGAAVVATEPPAGLSPRVRGNRRGRGGTRAQVRSIPACAGEPPRARSMAGSARVYPRVCGGTSSRAVRSTSPAGLSPRVRGNRPHRGRRRRRPGSIPACAGEPGGRRPATYHPRVYPRVCGGTVVDLTALLSGGGLSPRVRGNRAAHRIQHGRAGSIPACAGEPSSRPPESSRLEVYPRVCGGTAPVAVGPVSAAGLPRVCGGTATTSGEASFGAGLSPRVRGNRDEGALAAAELGSIPACAGEPSAGSRTPPRCGVYPRVCGGTVDSTRAAANKWGLSPRVRGNRIRDLARLDRGGSIPACAGEPSWRGGPGRPSRVYPRVCGGTPNRIGPWPYASGLSPRVRGNRLTACSINAIPGSIPACAGEPHTESSVPYLHRVYPRVCGGTSRSRRSTSPL